MKYPIEDIVRISSAIVKVEILSNRSTSIMKKCCNLNDLYITLQCLTSKNDPLGVVEKNNDWNLESKVLN